MTDARKKWFRRAAIAGMLLGGACHFLPPEYQAVCLAAAKIAPLACGAPGGS